MIENKTENIEVLGEEAEIKDVAGVVDADEEEVKTAPDVIDLLLSTDYSKFKLPRIKVKIPRLSELTGSDFIIELRMLNNTITKNIEKLANSLEMDEDGNPDINIDTDIEIVKTLIEATYTLDGQQLFKNGALRKHFNVKSNDDLVRKMLLPGERKKIYDRYKKMAGYIKTSVEDIKN